LGCTVDELLARLSSRELTEWLLVLEDKAREAKEREEELARQYGS
jgi:hypothetical protein